MRRSVLLYEYMIISRGGQGGVTAARILATAAVLEGKYAQAIPQFGAERRGAIVRSYLRVSSRPIRRHSSVKNPIGVAVFSSRILQLVDVSSIAPKNAILLVNSGSEIPLLKSRGYKYYYVDATSIAVKLGLVIAGWPVVNTAMAAAMAKVFRITSLDSVLKAMEDYFTGKLLEVNRKAAIQAWQEVKEG